MEELRFITPDVSMSEEIAAYRREFLDSGSSMDGCGSLASMEDPKDWLSQVEALSDEKTVPENWVRSTQFVLMRGQRILGTLQVRHCFNDFLRDYGGHIGYSVRPCERRKGYASRMLKEALPFCRSIGLDKVLITCLRENEGSRRTILKNGGVYESTVIEPQSGKVLERYWISLSKANDMSSQGL